MLFDVLVKRRRGKKGRKKKKILISVPLSLVSLTDSLYLSISHLRYLLPLSPFNPHGKDWKNPRILLGSSASKWVFLLKISFLFTRYT